MFFWRVFFFSCLYLICFHCYLPFLPHWYKCASFIQFLEKIWNGELRFIFTIPMGTNSSVLEEMSFLAWGNGALSELCSSSVLNGTCGLCQLLSWGEDRHCVSWVKSWYLQWHPLWIPSLTGHKKGIGIWQFLSFYPCFIVNWKTWKLVQREQKGNLENLGHCWHLMLRISGLGPALVRHYKT